MMFRRRVPLTWMERLRSFFLPRRGFSRTAAYFRKRVVRLKASPHAIAAGVAAGTFSSFTPFIGFHILLGFAVAFLLRGSMLAAALGTAVGNPLTFPFIWLATFEVGRFILAGGQTATHGHGPEAPDAAMLSQGLFENGISQLWPTLKPMIIGSVPLGATAAVLLYVVSYKAAAAHQARRRAKRLTAGQASVQGERSKVEEVA